MIAAFSRIREFLVNVFLLPEEAPIFHELLSDKNLQYQEVFREYWALDGTFVALDYTDGLKRELEAYKYHSRREKKDIFLPHISDCYRFFCLEDIDRDAIVCSVPIRFWSRLKRGYNHSELLARDLAKKEGTQYLGLLRKSRNTKHQAMLTKSERLKNVRGSFAFRTGYLEAVRGKDIILVDDVISTGSTVNECAHLLKKNGAKRVYGILLATGG